MTTTLAITALLAVVVAALWQSRRISALARTAPARVRRPMSPVQEAERILARRYARGEIGLDEYRRMLAILRH